eukprot:IDg21552t1
MERISDGRFSYSTMNGSLCMRPCPDLPVYSFELVPVGCHA